MSEPDSGSPGDSPGRSAEDRAVARRVRRELSDDVDQHIPKLPRGKGFKLPKGHLFKIASVTILLVLIIVMHRQCAHSVATFVTSFDGKGSPKLPNPSTVECPEHYELIHPGMTEAEQKAAIERELDRASSLRTGSGSGQSLCLPRATGSGSGAPATLTPGSAR